MLIMRRGKRPCVGRRHLPGRGEVVRLVARLVDVAVVGELVDCIPAGQPGNTPSRYALHLGRVGALAALHDLLHIHTLGPVGRFGGNRLVDPTL